jgi:predicted DNA-binding protein (MmcQ/YjbR family)
MSAPRGAATGALRAAEAALRAHALARPEATEHFPWGERAIKVNGKVFLFLSADATRLSLSTKLPSSSGVALLLPFASSTGYGLGKAGWVTARFEATDRPPVELLCAWIDESYQAVAPSRLAALARSTDAQAAASPPPTAKLTKRPTAAKPTTAKPTTAKPTTAKPTAAKPTAAKPATAKPTAAKPTAAKPTTAKPTTAKRAKPTAAKRAKA